MKIFFLLLFTIKSIYAIDIDSLQKAMDSFYSGYENSQEYKEKEYKQLMDNNLRYYESLIKSNEDYYRQQLGIKWGEENIKLSSKSSFTQYNDDLNSRETVDFKNGKITIEILSKKTIEDIEIFKKEFASLKKQTIADTYLKDPVNNKTFKQLKQKKDIGYNSNIYDQMKLLDEKIINKKNFSKKDIQHKNVHTKQGDKRISFVVIKMVPHYLKIKAEKYKALVQKYAKTFHVENSLVFGIMHTESYFNPLARSNIPAFGLMQIVPQTAGTDAYYALYKIKKTLPPYYLYNVQNNIKLGVKYIEIIQKKYLQGIKDKEKLFFCTATSYNAGIGSLCKSITNQKTIKNFNQIRQRAIDKINKMSKDQLFKHLTTSNMLTDEAKNYIKKVRKNTKNYLAWDN